ncbi:hypothetical protein KFL_002540270 [Klebsormidium nitens]|uniref:Uncharacterized protein n=1 Tax=Klebsormidium nitens TaxID=105231 RepID=A0A1Y1I5M5_KLENI|nr:hypothetical protein KFL_002540270 [Klebsormidium nitens]|eukprot:GAQ85793.1 hypothetical protein KFL_002540270 [Klebsormidium nitens]
MEVAASPRVDVLLKEELGRFRSELQSVRASFESAPHGRGEDSGGALEDDLMRQHSFLSDSDLSSDGSDWEECLLGHEEDTRRVKQFGARSTAAEELHVDNQRELLHWQPAAASARLAMGRELGREQYAPDEPPTRQRPRQSAESTNAPLVFFVVNSEGEMLGKETNQTTSPSMVANPNPNPNGGGLEREETFPNETGHASELAGEQLVSGDTEQDEGFEEESDGTAKEMALKIQLLLERRGGSLEMKDWDWLLSPNALSRQPMVLPSEGQGLRVWEAVSLAEGNSADALGESSLKQASEGSEEAQAYLARVLASLVPAQRLTPLASADGTQGGISEAVEAAGGGKTSTKGQQGSLGAQLVVDLPNSSNKLGPSSSVENSRRVLSEGIGRRESGSSSVGPQSKLPLLKPNLHSDPNVQGRAQVVETAPADSEAAMQADENGAETSRPVPQSDDEISEPAPRAKLVVLPSIRGGAVQKPSVAVHTTPRPKEDGAEPKVAPSLTSGVKNQVDGDGAHREGATTEGMVRAAESASDNDTGVVRSEGVPQVGQVTGNVASEMEARVRMLEVLQRRTLELQEQKVQHEIEMQKRRAELELQSLSVPQASGTRDPVGVTGNADLAPLRPATALLAQAREAAHEVVDAVSKLQSVPLPASQEAPAPISTATPAPALSRQLATAVTDLKEMLDRKLGEFYAACASFHAASLQGAAQLAQAAHVGQGHVGGERRAAAAHAMARQTAELDSLRQQVRGSHQVALQSPAFRLRTPLPSKASSLPRSRSSTASQSSKRGPQDVASAAAELATGLREFKPEEHVAPSQWPGLESAVEEAVKAVEGHGMEWQLLVHAAHAKWRDLAAREEERANSAKAAVQALLGSAFDYDAAHKELELITRAAKGVPGRAKERAKDPAFQELAFASAAHNVSDSWEAPQTDHLSAQQAEEALFLERLRQDVDRRIAAAAALSTGMPVGAKRRRIGDPLGAARDRAENLAGNAETKSGVGRRRADGKENRGISVEGDVKVPEGLPRKAGSRGAQRREEKPVTLKKVEIAFGHKVKRPPAAQPPARKRKESGDAGWVKRMSEPRRPPESPGGEGGEDLALERAPRPGVPRRSTLRPGEMVHRPATAVRYPSPEPRQRRQGETRPVGAGMPGSGDNEGAVGRLVALAREAAAGLIAERLSERNDDDPAERSEEGTERDFGGSEPRGAVESAPSGGKGLEETARGVTEWLSEQVISQLLQRPEILEGLKAADSGVFSEMSSGAEAGGNDALRERLSDDVSIDEELVRAVAAEVISEEVDRMWAVGNQQQNAQRDSTREEEAWNSGDAPEDALGPRMTSADTSAQHRAEVRGEEAGAERVGVGVVGTARGIESGLSPPLEDEEEAAVSDSRPSVSQAPPEVSVSAAQPEVPAPPAGLAQAAIRAPEPETLGSIPVTQGPLPFPFLPTSYPASGLPSVTGPSQPWPFIPFPFYFQPDGRFVPGAPFPNPFPNPVTEPGLRENRAAAAQTEPQTAPQPKPVRVTRRIKAGSTPATPPTPSTPSSSPEVTLVRRKAVRRGFEAALEGMGISVRLAGELESETGAGGPDQIEAQRESSARGLGKQDGLENNDANEEAKSEGGREVTAEDEAERQDSTRVEDGQQRAEQEEAEPEGGAPAEQNGTAQTPLKEEDSPQAAPPTPALPAVEPTDGRPEEQRDVSATSAAGAEKSLGARARRRWAFLDERWDARQAVETMAHTLLAGGEEESSIRSGGSPSGGGRTSAALTESTSVSFGEVVAGLASEPSASFGGPPSGLRHEAEPQQTRQDVAATSSLSEGEAEPGDLRQDQEPGQRGRLAPPELSADSEPGLIRQQDRPGEDPPGRTASRKYRDQEDDDSFSESLDARGRRRRGTASAWAGGRATSRSQMRRPTPRKDVIRSAVATLRGLAKVRPADEASEGELESGADEGEVGIRGHEAGELRR